MVFTSISFLFLFLPVFLATHLLTPTRWRNAHILVLSLLFYAIGGGIYTGIFVLSIIANYAGGEAIAHSGGRARIGWLVATLAVDLSFLCWFKYAVFFAHTANALFGAVGSRLIPVPEIVLPIGISFYTFQGMAYAIDVYRRRHAPARSLMDFAVFKSNFPQIIAGPIVRFPDVSDAIQHRQITIEQFYEGFLRFAWGLFRKMIFADSLATIADGVFKMPLPERSMSFAWLGILCYTLQIYHDFAGYSDMAIGMGKMMGFRFPENFNEPYRASSVTMFWRRWHMTLSTWFRDYLYFPLGGNRAGVWKTYRNLFLVFFLCGLWHGAAYTFIVWGLFHGMLLIVERVLDNRFGLRPSGWWGWALTFLAVMIGWVFFRAESLPKALEYLKSLVGANESSRGFLSLTFYLTWDRLAILLAAMAMIAVPLDWVKARLEKWNESGRVMFLGGGATVMLVYASMVLASNGYNPFIYFRF